MSFLKIYQVCLETIEYNTKYRELSDINKKLLSKQKDLVKLEAEKVSSLKLLKKQSIDVKSLSVVILKLASKKEDAEAQRFAESAQKTAESLLSTAQQQLKKLKKTYKNNWWFN